jgi:hypothetical protein
MTFPPWAYPVILAALAAVILLMTLGAFVNRRWTNPDECVWAFRYYLGMLALALPGPLLALFFSIMALVEPPTPTDLHIFLILMGCSVGVGFPVCWEILRFGFAMTPEGVDVVSPWRGRWLIPWDDINAVSYGFGWFAVEARTHGTFRIPLMTKHLDEFLQECEAHLDPKQLFRAINGYSAVGRRFPYDG